ncbi:hypothetical protein GCM10022223_48480 [Kineosporia mesophila]|uniref:Phage protein n=1 Tax=Kineosporia mesophila TaxID=566012 RepID=A0ABP7A694_9ACTN|nr:hypothetical protein [Kineosporia mesophila]MCD5351539.1 hypothetical protein [Kineosporia mesophila]
MTAFATPEPTWTAIVNALDEDPSDAVWALKLIVQCRNHLRHALHQAGNDADLVPTSDPASWSKDPARKAPRRTENPHRVRRPSTDIPGGPEGARGFYERWHVLLGVLIAHEYEEVGRPAPAWTGRLRMKKDWVLPTPSMTDTQVRNSTPPWLAERGLFVSPRELAHA